MINQLMTWLRNLTIGSKLTFGFGVLVALTLVVIGIGYLSNVPATEKFTSTKEVSVPTVLASDRAQANLLRMLRDVRGYLALGEPVFRERYHQNRQAFETDLAELRHLSTYFSAENKERLQALELAFESWLQWPDQLFALRDDQIDREPAYQLLVQDAAFVASEILMGLDRLIDLQGERPATPNVVTQIEQMARFQSSFSSMLAGLRGYVTTRNHNFRSEYEANATANEVTWDELLKGKEAMTPEQQQILEGIAENRQLFLTFPEQMFSILESDRWRLDLYQFNTKAEPLAERMLQLLNDIVVDQQQLLQDDLAEGSNLLLQAQRWTLVGGLMAMFVGLGMALLLRRHIVGPIERLTLATAKITAGDLSIQSKIETKDEIGQLATSFNVMTGRLRDLIANLEQRVAERTVELEAAVKSLQTSADISRQITAILELNELLQSVVIRVHQEFNLYHTHIYLLEPETQDLVMVEGFGEVGRQLKARGHRLNYGQGIVGTVAKTKQPFISNDVDSVAHFYRNPLLPNTNSELAVPMRKGQELLGVLDIQSERHNRFSNDDVSLMQSIADQIAVAVDNARLLAEQTETILKLQELDRLKSEFIGMISHEMRTPMTAVLGFSELLLQGFSGELTTQAKEDVQLIYDNGQHLLKIINDILEVAKIETGQTKLTLQPVDVYTVVEEVKAMSQGMLRNKPVQLLDKLPDNLPLGHADPDRLRQILFNLVTNAIKFTLEGSVTILAEVVDQRHYTSSNLANTLSSKTRSLKSRWLRVTVVDTGVGISAEQQHTVFERFSQADMSDTRQYGGIGLGLTICKLYVEMHGGQIGVKSEAGAGSEFFFTIPLVE